MDNSIDTYLSIVIALFGATTSLFVVTSYRRMFSIKSKAFTFIWWILQTVLIVFVIFVVFKQISNHNEQKILSKEAKYKAHVDYINKIMDSQRKALLEKERREKVMNAVQKYFDVSKSQNITHYDSLFIFPVKKFFVITNVSKEKVNERIKFAWNHNPELSFMVTNENTHIDDYDDSVIALVNLNLENKVRNVIAKIKFDRNLKIYSINNFYQTQNPTQKILSPSDTSK